MNEKAKHLYLDIETASQAAHFDQLSPEWQELWAHKSRFYQEKESRSVHELYEDRAAIYSEFGKIICISVGSFDHSSFRVKSFVGEEKDLIKSFFDLINRSYSDARFSVFIGHNIREFDIPYICRRAVVNRVAIPPSFDLSGRKPWEVHHIHDTLEMWKFGDFKNFSSLDLLAHCLQLPTSKSDISGKDVGRVYWQDHDIARISKYCQQDVVLTARVYRRLRNESDISESDVISV